MTPTTETWLPVVGYEGLYEVSDHGRVGSLDRVDRFGRKFHGRVLRQTTADAGRKTVRLAREGGAKTTRISVLVLAAFVGPRPEGHEGCHTDGDPSNNRLSNLRWGTSSANRRDAVRHGTHNEARKTHCPRRHPLLAPNLARAQARKGRRICLACHRALSARWRAERAGKTFDMQQAADANYQAIMRA